MRSFIGNLQSVRLIFWKLGTKQNFIKNLMKTIHKHPPTYHYIINAWNFRFEA